MHSNGRHPVALAFEWVSRITTVVLEMVAPAWICWKIDQRFGLNNYLALAGLVFGLVLGITHLTLMARAVAIKGRVAKDKAGKENAGNENAGAGGRAEKPKPPHGRSPDSP